MFGHQGHVLFDTFIVSRSLVDKIHNSPEFILNANRNLNSSSGHAKVGPDLVNNAPRISARP